MGVFASAKWGEISPSVHAVPGQGKIQLWKSANYFCVSGIHTDIFITFFFFFSQIVIL